jgi:hypothetical protein
MDLKDFLAVSGKPGLFKMVSQGKSILIAENVETGQRIPIHSTNRVSSLEEIAVFTDSEDKPLKDILFDIYQKKDGKAVFDPRQASEQEIREFFAEAVPEYDRQKVYLSDMKKIILWYNILVTKGSIEWKASEPETGAETESEAEPETES